jgi:hypothetical protein
MRVARYGSTEMLGGLVNEREIEPAMRLAKLLLVCARHRRIARNRDLPITAA